VPVLPTLTVTQQVTARYANSTNSAPYANSTNSKLYANSTNSKLYANSTDSTILQFSWNLAQMPFVVEKSKQLLIRWVNQVNVPIYTSLNITSKGRGMASVPYGLKGIAFAVIITQRYDNINDLTLGTIAGPVVISVS
jgi:hypothetical protein